MRGYTQDKDAYLRRIPYGVGLMAAG